MEARAARPRRLRTDLVEPGAYDRRRLSRERLAERIDSSLTITVVPAGSPAFDGELGPLDLDEVRVGGEGRQTVQQRGCGRGAAGCAATGGGEEAGERATAMHMWEFRPGCPRHRLLSGAQSFVCVAGSHLDESPLSATIRGEAIAAQRDIDGDQPPPVARRCHQPRIT